ncbi:response regulator [Salegentibacter mishustinae]|uniref:Transcriptional regulator n=1 Tax=Salegentibacter mishustinae TaxID=270918 RepID=A0A0Q9Z4K2_9FLAO|nr:response regulator [Salegentibacter mishustinae]KRG27805.1 transcriptional regulator [Salegentibacter mishustinae]PNW20874.1 transcriptional regulator [Salegentibacter mishustinae]PZX64118.1 DNA-binding NarL/FixJ family response regulator [Salegentibacter mishustinae]GGW90262.1 DNA-binding response regulator [Salegentibacter mishustinae]
MDKSISVLIIDDHPIIASAYESALESFVTQNATYNFKITSIYNLDEAQLLLNNPNFVENIDLVFLDMRLPASSDGSLVSGEDLGNQIKTKQPGARIIVSTTFNDNYRLHNILQSINPEGFLVKNDINHKELLSAVENVLAGSPYYSKTVLNLLRKQVGSDIYLDEVDRKMLYELSIGSKLKDLTDLLPLSVAGIEKRRRNLKKIFGISGAEDRELVKVAKEKGFL